MKPLLRRLPHTILALALSLLLVRYGWEVKGSFFGLLFSSIAGVLLVAWALTPQGQAWPEPNPDKSLPLSDPPLPMEEGIVLALHLGGLGLIALAVLAALHEQLVLSLVAIVGAALCWRPAMDLRPEPGLDRRWLAGLMLAVMLLGGAFRFYRLGEVPLGMVTVDEPRLMVVGQEILDGKRETYYAEGFGKTPYWIEGAALWLFGDDIRGFRMSTILPGFMLIGLIGLLALELAGSRIGLLAAAFTAVCVWPVSFSRAEYLVNSSFVPMIAAPWLFLRGVRRGERLSLVLAGFFLGLCFSLYNPARLIPLFMLLLGAFLWIQKPTWREGLRWSWLPVLAGVVVGLGPLILWASKDLAYAYRTYFNNLDVGYMAGQNVVQAHGVLAKFDLVFGRILPGLPRVLTMFTTHGGMRPWFFKLDQPVVDRVTLFLLMAGLAVSLVRFRQAAYAFAVTWWLLGMTPTLLADPAYHMDERRLMLAMPATLLLAAIGLHGMLGLATRGLAKRTADRALLVAGLSVITLLTVINWRTYFVDIQLDRQHQEYNHYNFDCMTRAIFRAQAQGPVYVVSTRKPTEDSWWGANSMNELEEHFSILHKIPRVCVPNGPDYFDRGGIFGALRAIPSPSKEGGKAYEPLVVLTPFHFYLEPLLKELGGERVEDVPPVRAKDGINYQDVGMAWDAKVATRLVRLKGFSPGKLAALEARRLYPYTAEELGPPAGATREGIRALGFLNPDHTAMLQRYQKAPGSWRAGRQAQFRLADPYFWITAGNFPGNLSLPLRLKASWVLRVPKDGDYALGASATIYTAIKVDGKPVFSYLPHERAFDEATGRDGWLGAPVYLKAGDHSIEVEQVALTALGQFNHLIRLLWQAPGGEKETLPLEVLFPDGAAAKAAP